MISATLTVNGNDKIMEFVKCFSVKCLFNSKEMLTYPRNWGTVSSRLSAKSREAGKLSRFLHREY